ncbi:MAG TPA: NAD-dependent epimerase/dehydratase family protein [Opitutaceae bacterium]|jgi:CDP-paratose 2-epimerase|nr:NAD-dependent epimerase/dehydratase family protein [Opitutaceae bacterium]
MKILITGICGFVGSTLARELAQAPGKPEIFGIDNLSRAGSESNRAELKKLGVKFFHGDLRVASDIDALPACEWVVDAAANPSVLAGVDGQTSSRQLVEHNLSGTVNLLEYCKRHKAGFVLLSTSRVYSIAPLAALPMKVESSAFRPDFGNKPPAGASSAGISESFPTGAPVSLYGATKVASEALALEYGETFSLPVFINRCGVLAGAGQFGRPDQGIFAFWVNSWLRKRPLKYIGFDGQGHQVRDCLHPRDLVPLLLAQFQAPKLAAPDRIVNLGGGVASARSLRQLSDWCAGKFGAHGVSAGPASRAFDLPWIVLDCAKAGRIWQWRPQTPVDAILEEIAVHAGNHPDWLELSAG